ncbi:MAG: glycogen synthase GlgA [Bacteroidetes bacterium]|nr:glycogen synthase GlgA [Bacteroidota bacterium]
MSRSLKILFVSSEIEPFAKTGGLADVSSALPQMIRELGHDIRVMMPRYGTISDRKFKLHDVIRLKELQLPVGNSFKTANVNSSFITNIKTKVQVYLLANKELYGRNGIYGSATTLKEFQDNDDRYIFFARGVLETLKRLGWQPDIIHCNDWQTGLIPAYMKTIYADDPFFIPIKTVFTIHNLHYQGNFPSILFSKTNLPPSLMTKIQLNANGHYSFMKAGLLFADVITTVSPQYAKEIASDKENSNGINEIISKRKRKLYGILNGIDYNTWNPEIDPLISKRYNYDTIDSKIDNKIELLEKFGLGFDKDIPVVGIITRLVPEKGIDLIQESIDELMKLNLKLVMLCSGSHELIKFFSEVSKKYKGKFGFKAEFNPDLVHIIEAGCDFYLMPSKYEPCGLNQMYSMRYGTIPIVRSVGGLVDTVIDSSKPGGTGFTFSKYTSEELIKTVERALKAYSQQSTWRRLVKNAMSKDYSWKTSANKYINLYNKLL